MNEPVIKLNAGFAALPRVRQLAAAHAVTIVEHGGWFIKRLTIHGPADRLAEFQDDCEADIAARREARS